MRKGQSEGASREKAKRDAANASEPNLNGEYDLDSTGKVKGAYHIRGANQDFIKVMP